MSRFLGLHRAFVSTTLIACCCGLSGCSTLGPATIESSRTSYNDVVQETAKQQTLLNLLRVRDGQQPNFIDVTEVDAGYSLAHTTSGTAGGIGATLIGSVTGGVTYTDAPTIRYQPLTGNALIQQVSVPLTTASLANLYDSDFPLLQLLVFGVDNISPGYEQYWTVVNTLAALDDYGAIVLAAPFSDQLVVYLQPNHADRTDDKCFGAKSGSFTDQQRISVIRSLWSRLLRIYGIAGGDAITLGTLASQAKKGSAVPSQLPLLHTRSALGVLKNLTESDEAVGDASPVRIAVDSPENLAPLRSAKRECTATFYIDNRSVNYRASVASPFTADVRSSNLSDDFYLNERALDSVRRYILVDETAEPLANSYTTVQFRGKWYSIEDDDKISKRNLSLISEIATIQAIPNNTPTLVSSINVGAPR